jgi:hypothetical protein
MCDYSLHLVASRPAKVGDKLVATDFVKSITGGFAAVGEPHVAVCLLPGTELAFEENVQYQRAFSLFGDGGTEMVLPGATISGLTVSAGETFELTSGASSPTGARLSAGAILALGQVSTPPTTLSTAAPSSNSCLGVPISALS